MIKNKHAKIKERLNIENEKNDNMWSLIIQEERYKYLRKNIWEKFKYLD